MGFYLPGPTKGKVKLAGDAHAVAGFAHAALEHLAYTQFARDLLHVDGAAL